MRGLSGFLSDDMLLAAFLLDDRYRARAVSGSFQGLKNCRRPLTFFAH